MEVDMRSAEGQALVQRLIAAAGVFITTVAARQWHSYSELSALRPDLIHLEVVGRGDGSTGSTTPSTPPPDSRWAQGQITSGRSTM